MRANCTICIQLFVIIFSGSCFAGNYFFPVNEYEPTDAEVFIEQFKRIYQPQVYDGIKEPDRVPSFQENRKTILGIDLNKDEVRDDLEIYINRKIESDTFRIIYKEYLRQYQQVFRNYEKWNKLQMQEVLSRRDGTLKCFQYLIGSGFLSKEDYKKQDMFLGFMILNTPERNAVARAVNLKAGTVGADTPTPKSAFKYCPASIKMKFPADKGFAK